MPPKSPEIIPWNTLCIDLIGLYKIGDNKNEVTLHCLTMIDPATSWFEIAVVPTKQADDIVNILEFSWLTRYPWPTEIIIDRGKEFVAKVQDTIHNKYDIKKKLITTQNPQANAMVEQVHQTVHNMVHSLKVQGKQNLDPDFCWAGVLSAVCQAVIGTVHTTNKATPSQLVFNCDAILNINFQADWEYLKLQKQKQIHHNNKKENAKCLPHQFGIGDQVLITLAPNHKQGADRYSGPHTITQVNNNGTVILSKTGRNGGALFET